MPVSKKKAAEHIDIRQINFGHVQPQALDAEHNVLGNMLNNKNVVSDTINALKPEYFYDSRNEKVFVAAQHLFSNKMPVDAISIVEQLKKDGELENAGGIEYVADLSNNLHSAMHLEYYYNVITQKYLARELIRIAVETQTRAFDDKTDVEDLIQDAQGQVFQISQQNIKKDAKQINPYILEAVERIREANKNSDGLSGVSSGFPEVDKITFGWQKSDLIIIAARPAMGKTAFVLSMIKNIAVDGVMTSKGNTRIPCAMFSLEMSCVQLVNRLIINVCRLSGDKIKSGHLDKSEWDILDAGVNRLQDAPIYLDDTPQLSVLEFRTKAMRLVQEHNVQIIFIDYLQLMNAQGMNFFSREGEVSLISRSLKGMAKELNIPIIALSQLNRNTERRGADTDPIEGKKPQLADLRESGAIEQDADIVGFIHRPDYYKITQDKDGNDLRGIAQLIIAKHRNGATEDINLRFRKEYAQFLSVNSYDETPMPDNSMLMPSRTNVDYNFEDPNDFPSAELDTINNNY